MNLSLVRNAIQLIARSEPCNDLEMTGRGPKTLSYLIFKDGQLGVLVYLNPLALLGSTYTILINLHISQYADISSGIPDFMMCTTPRTYSGLLDFKCKCEYVLNLSGGLITHQCATPIIFLTRSNININQVTLKIKDCKVIKITAALTLTRLCNSILVFRHAFGSLPLRAILITYILLH